MSSEKGLNNSVPFAPLFLCKVAAGFPSPAEDFREKNLDLNELLIQRPASTFFVRVSGESMRDGGIMSGDLLIVDRGKSPKSGDVVLAVVDGDFTVKRWEHNKSGARLLAENPAYASIEISDSMEFEIWGVVTFAIHEL